MRPLYTRTLKKRSSVTRTTCVSQVTHHETHGGPHGQDEEGVPADVRSKISNIKELIEKSGKTTTRSPRSKRSIEEKSDNEMDEFPTRNKKRVEVKSVRTSKEH